ncbi:UPF0597 protein [Aureibacter tunicatorum]|nr:UPF0597 protein [Aureibacter tunicatorum]
MALGCTEPIAACLAVVKAREILGKEPDRVELHVSGNIYKNGLGVGIPGTKMKGLLVAGALGIYTGSSSDLLEVLKNVNSEIAEAAESFVSDERISVQIIDNVDKLYIKAKAYAGEDCAITEIAKSHTNIISGRLNGELVFEKDSDIEKLEASDESSYAKLSVASIVEFAKSTSFDSISFIMQGVDCNWSIAHEGLNGEYGLQVGKKLHATYVNSLLGNEIMVSAMSKAAAGVDARMSGSMMPVMTNSGSGNQGITIYVPIIDLAEKLKAREDILARALIIANAIPIHIKHSIGPLSALCGIVPASAGVAAGASYLLGGDVEQIKSAVQYVLGNTSGVFCDGAKPSCALKSSTGISAAIQAAIFSTQNCITPNGDGILDNDVEETIVHLSKIASIGMAKTDDQIIEIMKSK